MPIPITLPKGSLITLNSTALSEHNRSSARIDPEYVKFDKRTITGTARRYYLATKKSITVSWSMLPALDNQTVDGKAGRNTLKTFVDDNIDNTFTVYYYEVNSSNVQTQVSFTGFIATYNEELVKRWDRQMWNVSITITEQ